MQRGNAFAQDSSQPNQGQSDAMADSESASEGETDVFFRWFLGG